MSHERCKTVSIGEAARLCGVSVKQIRHWQDRQYIPAPQRVVCAERAYRQFSHDDLAIIKRIKSYLDEGFRLDIAAEKANADLAGETTNFKEEDFNNETNTN